MSLPCFGWYIRFIRAADRPVPILAMPDVRHLPIALSRIRRARTALLRRCSPGARRTKGRSLPSVCKLHMRARHGPHEPIGMPLNDTRLGRVWRPQSETPCTRPGLSAEVSHSPTLVRGWPFRMSRSSKISDFTPTVMTRRGAWPEPA